MFTDRKELVNYELDIEYKIAVLKGKIDNALKENNKQSFIRYSNELNEVENERKKASQYNQVFFKVW